MTRHSVSRTASFFASFLTLLLCGCTPEFADVQGSVRYNGMPVEKGTVTFTPAGGLGAVVGGKIENGRFNAQGVSPGQNIVVVAATRNITFPQDSQSMATNGPPVGPGGKDTNWKDPADLIPHDADGNNGIHNLMRGRNTIDLQLSAPKSP